MTHNTTVKVNINLQWRWINLGDVWNAGIWEQGMLWLLYSQRWTQRNRLGLLTDRLHCCLIHPQNCLRFPQQLGERWKDCQASADALKRARFGALAPSGKHPKHYCDVHWMTRAMEEQPIWVELLMETSEWQVWPGDCAAVGHRAWGWENRRPTFDDYLQESASIKWAFFCRTWRIYIRTILGVANDLLLLYFGSAQSIRQHQRQSKIISMMHRANGYEQIVGWLIYMNLLFDWV